LLRSAAQKLAPLAACARPPTPALALRASAGASVNSAGYEAALAEAS